jgi:DNA-binding MarR family transcriptional regulator
MSNDTAADAGADDATEVARKAEIVQLLMGAGETARAVVATTLRENGAPSSAADMLWALATNEKPMTLREIAVRLGRDPSTVTLAADKLEGADLLERRPHPTDGRKRTLVLTDRGLDLWRALRNQLHASDMFTDLGRDEQLILLELLRRIR